MSAESAKKKQVPIMEGIFTLSANEPRLIGSQCKKCKSNYFPVTFRCHDPACGGDEVEQILISRRGKLWSYTVQYYHLPPPYKSVGEFKPFGIGQVEFPEGMRVAGIIAGCDAEKDLKIGMEMDLVLDKLYDDDQGNEIIGWKFKPAK